MNTVTTSGPNLSGTRWDGPAPAWAVDDVSSREEFDDLEGHGNFWKSSPFLDSEKWVVRIEQIEHHNRSYEPTDEVSERFVTVEGGDDGYLDINSAPDMTVAQQARNLAAALIAAADAIDELESNS